MRRLLGIASLAGMLAATPLWAADDDEGPSCSEQCHEEQVMCEEYCRQAEEGADCIAVCEDDAAACAADCD